MDSNIDTSERTRRQNLASNARKLISQVLQAEDVAGSPLQLQHFGSHAVNVKAGRYSYRSIHWLDTELGRDRFLGIPKRGSEETGRAFAQFS